MNENELKYTLTKYPQCHLKYVLNSEDDNIIEQTGGGHQTSFTDGDYEYRVWPYNYSDIDLDDIQNNPKLFIRRQLIPSPEPHQSVKLQVYETHAIYEKVKQIQYPPTSWISLFRSFFNNTHSIIQPDHIEPNIYYLDTRLQFALQEIPQIPHELKKCIDLKTSTSFLIYKKDDLIIFSIPDAHSMMQDIQEVCTNPSDIFNKNTTEITELNQRILEEYRQQQSESTTDSSFSNIKYCKQAQLLNGPGKHSFGVLIYSCFVCRIEEGRIHLLESMRELTQNDAKILRDFNDKFKTHICREFGILELAPFFIGGFHHWLLKERCCMITYEMHQPTYINVKSSFIGMNFHNLEAICKRLIQNHEYFKDLSLKTTYSWNIFDQLCKLFNNCKSINTTFNKKYSIDFLTNLVNYILTSDLNNLFVYEFFYQNVYLSFCYYKDIYNIIIEIIEYYYRINLDSADNSNIQSQLLSFINNSSLKSIVKINDYLINLQIILTTELNELHQSYATQIYAHDIDTIPLQKIIEANENLDNLYTNENYKQVLHQLFLLNFEETIMLFMKHEHGESNIPILYDCHYSFVEQQGGSSDVSSDVSKLKIVRVHRGLNEWRTLVCANTETPSNYKLVKLNINPDFFGQINKTSEMEQNIIDQSPSNDDDSPVFFTYTPTDNSVQLFNIEVTDLTIPSEEYNKYCVESLSYMVNTSVANVLNKIQQMKSNRANQIEAKYNKFPNYLLYWVNGINPFHETLFTTPPTNNHNIRKLCVRTKEFMFGPAMDVWSDTHKTSLESWLKQSNTQPIDHTIQSFLKTNSRFLSWKSPKFIQPFIVYDDELHTYIPIIWFLIRNNRINLIQDLIANYGNIFSTELLNSPFLGGDDAIPQLNISQLITTKSYHTSPDETKLIKDDDDLRAPIEYSEDKHSAILKYMYLQHSIITNNFSFNNDIIQTHHLFSNVWTDSNPHIRISTLIITNESELKQKSSDLFYWFRNIGTYTLDIQLLIQHLQLLNSIDIQYIRFQEFGDIIDL